MFINSIQDTKPFAAKIGEGHASFFHSGLSAFQDKSTVYVKHINTTIPAHQLPSYCVTSTSSIVPIDVMYA